RAGRASLLGVTPVEVPDALEAHQAGEGVEGIEGILVAGGRALLQDGAVDRLHRLAGGEESRSREDRDPVADLLEARARKDGRASALDHVRDQRSVDRSEEHTSELQSRENLVCRLLLELNKRYAIIV